MEKEINILSIAQQSIQKQSDAITRLANELDTTFSRIVDLVFRTKGRLIITGVGKSAIIAQKIVATLNSTGTPAGFLHASDAIHGDWGMVGSDDVLLCISKSGCTAVYEVLIPLVKKQGNTIIAFVCQKPSYLSKSADHTVVIPFDKEAGPNNLAPTTSTTLQMVLGDALAVSLLVKRGFSPDDFALLHPDGSLGKQLFLHVRDIYPQHEKPAVNLDTSLTDIILEITSKRLGATAVVDEKDNILGIITDGDLRRLLHQNMVIDQIKAVDIMSPQPKTIKGDELAVQGLEILRQYSITQLIVEEDGIYLGMIHLHDLLKEGII